MHGASGLRLRLLSPLLALVLAVWMVGGAHAAPARLPLSSDPCGDAPDIIDITAWMGYQICEMGQTVTSSISSIGDGLGVLGTQIGDGFSALGSTMHDVGDAIVSGFGTAIGGLQTFFTPSNSAWTPISTAFDNMMSGYEPFHTITLLHSEIDHIQSAWAGGAGSSGGFPGGGPSGGAGVPETGDYGAISGGLAIFVGVMNSAGLSQGTVKAIIDWGIAIGALLAITRDIGVQWGRL